ncbi:MAG: LacI family DNA-binding transcriptional regulator [Planctomycetota bacterium]
MAPTLKEISRLAGTSVSTASRIVNGQTGHRFSVETRQAVLDAARTLNYRPQKAAQTLATGKTNNVAVIVNNLANPFFGYFASLLQTRLMQRGLTAIPIEIRSEETGQDKAHWLEWVDQRDVDAAIDLQGDSGPWLNAKELETYARFIQHRPLVLRRNESHPLGVPVDFVHVDYNTGLRDLARHLKQTGWQRIGVVTVRGHMPQHIAARQELVSTQNFTAELRDHLDAANLESRLAWWRGVDDERGASPDWYHATLDVLTRNPDLDTLIVHNVDALPPVLQAIATAGRTVGQDLALASFDDLPASRWLGPGITVVSEPYTAVAEGLIDLMSRRLEAPDDDVRQVHLPTELVVRRSTCADAID